MLPLSTVFIEALEIYLCESVSYLQVVIQHSFCL
jgi:hypothetical protein